MSARPLSARRQASGASHRRIHHRTFRGRPTASRTVSSSSQKGTPCEQRLLRRRALSLAMSTSVAALAAQPSFANGTGTVSGCRCWIGRAAAASPRVPLGRRRSSLSNGLVGDPSRADTAVELASEAFPGELVKRRRAQHRGRKRRCRAVHNRRKWMAACRTSQYRRHHDELGGLKGKGQHCVDPQDQYQGTPLLGR